MLTSSEGRWRKRLHLPTSSGHSGGNRHHHYEERRHVQGLDASSVSVSTASSSSPTQHASMTVNSNPNSGNNKTNSLGSNSNVIADHMSQQRLSSQRMISTSSPGPSDHGESTPAWLLDHPPHTNAGILPSNSNSHHLGAVSNSIKQPRGGAAATASLIIISLVTYVLYHACMEALVDETGVAWAGTLLAQRTSAGIGGGAGRARGGEGASEEGNAWGPGVSVIAVSAWQSFAALCAGFVMSRARKTSSWRRVEVRPLGDLERTRRNRCLFVFAAAHLLGTALEYHSYGVVGPVPAEILRATETAFFCVFGLLFFGSQKGCLASLPTLLLAFGLALGAAPAAGDFGVTGVGLQFSLASSVLLAVRAVAAKMALDDYGLDEVSALFSGVKMTAGLQVAVLLIVEVPRAASGLPPRLLPHLWGVGPENDSDSFKNGDGRISVNGSGGGVEDGGWIAAEERARLALLLLANGLCLYGHVLALFGLSSRLSATMFAIVSGYVRAALVFVLLLSLQGSATYRSSAGMLLSTMGVVAHFYRTYASSKQKPPTSTAGSRTGLLRDGEDSGQGTGGVLPLPQLPIFLRESTPPAATSFMGGGGGDDSLSSPGTRRTGSRQPQTLFVPLLGTRHGIAGAMGTKAERTGEEGWRHGGFVPSSSSHSGSGATSNSDEEAGGSIANSALVISHNDGDGGHGSGVSPSRFTWRWMGLRHGTSATTATGDSGLPSSVTVSSPSPPLLQHPHDVEDGSPRFLTPSAARSGTLRTSASTSFSRTNTSGSVAAARGPYSANSGSYTAISDAFTASSGPYTASAGVYNAGDGPYSAGAGPHTAVADSYSAISAANPSGSSAYGLTRGAAADGSLFVADLPAAAAAGTENSGPLNTRSHSGPPRYRVAVGLAAGRGTGTGMGVDGNSAHARRHNAEIDTRSGSLPSNDRHTPHSSNSTIAYGDSGAIAYGVSSVVGGAATVRGCGSEGDKCGGRDVVRRSSVVSLRSPSPSSCSSFSLNGFELIDKEDLWS